MDSLRNQPGLRGITIDAEARELRLRYDPEAVSTKRIEALAREINSLLAETRDTCELRRESDACRECPAFGDSDDPSLEGVQWVQSSGQTVGVELRGSHPGSREFTIDTHRLQARLPGRVSLEGFLEVLPVLLCGTFLGLGWLLDALGLPGSLGSLLVAVVAGGLPTAWSTLRSLLARKLDVDLLMLMGAVGAGIIGHWDESAMLLFLFTLSSTLESLAMGRTRRAVESLVALRPDEATIVRDGRQERIPVEEVQVGERIVVRPGDRVPLDGRVIDGEADVDESALTGESLPRPATEGSSLLSGSINLNGSLVVEVTRASAESTLTRIVELVHEARENRAPTQRAFENFARYYIVLILLGATSTAVLPPLLGAGSWSEMFYRAMILLVVASPCALVISTPATLLSAIAAAARRGILFKGGAVIETLGQATAVAFDKTGTLTDGTLVVRRIEKLSDISEDEVLTLAAAAERSSEHVLARGIATAARDRDLSLPEVDHFRAYPGLGIEADIAGERILVGNSRFLENRNISLPGERSGVSVGVGKAVWLARGDRVAGRIYLGDQLRPEVPRVVRRLRRLGIGQVVMLTGDDGGIARSVGDEAGIEDLRANLLPDEKVAALRRLSEAGEACIMVGDGVNDAPAMAAATVGVAMGAAGSDVALEAADVVLMSSNLDKLAEAVELTRRARRILYANLFFASAVIVILITLAFSGSLALPVGVAGHEGSTLLVVLNGLRLLAWRPREPDG